MGWTIRLIDPPAETGREEHLNPDGSVAGLTTWRVIAVGDAWFATPAPGGGWLVYPDAPYKVHPSPHYLRHNAHRPPLIVCLPSKHGRFHAYPWCIDEQAHDRSGPHGDGWTVTGDAPRITMQPSINIVGDYHGWIRDGVITEDCEGRTYPC